MMNIKKILMLTIFLAIFAMFTGTVSAANWTVNPGDNIQSTVDQASSTDTIIVNDDNGTAYTYNENIVINKNISLQSGGEVTIQAADSNSNVITIISDGSTTIRGFTVTGGYNGIYLDSASNCYIKGNNISNNWFGMYSYSSPNNTISGNNITDNWAYGLYFDSSPSFMVA